MQVQKEEYPTFKGLQRPLEMFGFRGRYITWAAVTIGATFLSFIITFLIFNFLPAFFVGIVCMLVGAVKYFVAQRKGLYSKKIDKGVFVYTHRKII